MTELVRRDTRDEVAVSTNGHRAGGLREVVDITASLAGTAVSLARRLTADVAMQALQTGKEILDDARHGRDPSEIATTVIHGWAEGARTVLGVDQDLEKVGRHVGRLARPVADVMPSQVKSVAEQVTSFAPVRAALGISGVTAQEVRWNLRQKGMALIKRSTALDDPDEHPALRRILDELSPDEARVIRLLATNGPQAVIDVIASNPMTRKKRAVVHNYSLLGREAGCIRPHRAPLYLDNLERLGVVAVRPYRLRSRSNYELLECQPEVMDVPKPKGKLVRLKTFCKGVELSEFGKEMYVACLETPQHRLCAAPDEL